MSKNLRYCQSSACELPKRAHRDVKQTPDLHGASSVCYA